MDENRNTAQQLLQIAAREGFKRAASWVGGGTLLLFVIFVVVMAAMSTFLGGGLPNGQGPPIGSVASRPVLWLDYPAVTSSDLPNVVVLAVMAHESSGRVFAQSYNCSGGLAAPESCARSFPGTQTLSEDAGLMQINSGGWPVPENATKWRVLQMQDDPFDPAKNLPAGVAELSGDLHRYRYLEYGLEAYNSGSGGAASSDASYAAAVRGLIGAYEAGPTISVWSTADYMNGMWTVRTHQKVWLVVAAAGPYGAAFSVPWAPSPPKCKLGSNGGKVCTPAAPEKLEGREFVLPATVTANGETMALSPANAPLWPGEGAYALQVRGSGTWTIRATWPGEHTAESTITLAPDPSE